MRQGSFLGHEKHLLLDFAKMKNRKPCFTQKNCINDIKHTGEEKRSREKNCMVTTVLLGGGDARFSKDTFLASLTN